MRRKKQDVHTRIVQVMAVLLYGWFMWYAITSDKRWLGPVIDGPKHEWEHRMNKGGGQ